MISAMLGRFKKILGFGKQDLAQSFLKAGYSIKKEYDQLLGNRFLVVKSDSMPEPVFLRENSSDIATFRKIYIDHEYGVTFENPPKFIVDAGANIGISTVNFADRFPDSTIVALEPEPGNFQLLVRNTQSRSNIFPIQAALWHEKTSLNIIDFGKHDNFQVVNDQMLFHDGEIKSKIERYNGKVMLHCDSLSVMDLLSRFQMDRIGLLKMDIEGSEREVFIHSSEWIGKVDSIIVELHDKWHPGCNDAFQDNTIGFDSRWLKGESHFISRNNQMSI